jgi:hypothetical protein
VRRALVVCLAVVLSAGVARAALLRGTPRADVIAGTPAVDTIESLAGNDRITTAWDDKVDAVNCGAGRDVLNVDVRDTFVNCEAVAHRLSRDTTTDFNGQHATQVEPDSFVVGSTIVTAFQNGRYQEGGAAAIAWATSRNAGKTWRAGTLAQTRYSLVSDPVVAYDVVHRTWLIAALGAAPANVELWVSRSADGLAWSAPIVAADDPVEDYDKEWVACDNGVHSAFRGRCYLAYVDFAAQILGVRRSLDGGRTWSSAVRLTPGAARVAFTGPMPIMRPDGTLVIPYIVFGGSQDQVSAVVSQDGGETFGAPSRISSLTFEDDADLRSEAMPSVDVDAAGTLYLVWSDARFREDSGVNDVVFSMSVDGVRWTEPVRIALPPSAAGVGVNYVLPAIAVAPGTSGRKAKLAVAVYSERLRNGCAVFLPGCTKQVDAWLVRSSNGGRTWSAPKLLSAEPMSLQWLADTTRGAMLGDYISVSWAGGKPWAVLPLATRSEFGFSEAIFAATAS